MLGPPVGYVCQLLLQTSYAPIAALGRLLLLLLLAALFRRWWPAVVVGFVTATTGRPRIGRLLLEAG